MLKFIHFSENDLVIKLAYSAAQSMVLGLMSTRNSYMMLFWWFKLYLTLFPDTNWPPWPFWILLFWWFGPQCWIVCEFLWISWSRSLNLVFIWWFYSIWSVNIHQPLRVEYHCVALGFLSIGYTKHRFGGYWAVIKHSYCIFWWFGIHLNPCIRMQNGRMNKHAFWWLIDLQWYSKYVLWQFSSRNWNLMLF